MIGKDSEEQPELKVNDRRKFNIDGSLREGVEIEPEKPKAAENVSAETASAAPIAETTGETEEEKSENLPFTSAEEDEEEFDDSDIPGADDPASFVNFLTTLASQAASALGAVPHPVTGQRQVDLESGRYWIDVLAMLEEKTKGNLHEQEARLLTGLLSDLRMQFVAINRVAEERLKQQAAQNFSANDILGKK
ncbi:MAG: DUF1844 domain-containing protein [Pyrinomonadaceae bacterium]